MPEKPEALFDKRVVERNIKRGRITQKDHKNYLSRLRDLEEKAEPLFREEELEQEGILDGQQD